MPILCSELIIPEENCLSLSRKQLDRSSLISRLSRESHAGQYFSGPNGSGNTRVNGALYPFGYGLSYTSFAYNNLQIKQDNKQTQSAVTISCDLTNTGDRTGDEVVQLYIRDKVASVITYESVLRGFERVPLQPGETKTVTFTLYPEDLQILDRHYEWTVEPGEFEVRIGSSSEDIRLKVHLRN